MSALGALVWNGFRESRRNRVTAVVAVFAAAMLLSSGLVMDLTVVTFDRVLTDLGLGVMSLISVFLAVFLSTGLIPREVERRTLFMVLTRPISRSTFVVGRLLGNLLTLGFVIASMTALFALQVVVLGGAATQAQVVAVLGLLLEVMLLSSIGFLFASMSSQFVAALCTTGLFFIGHLSTDLYRLAERSKDAATQALLKALYYLLPNLDRLDFKARATYGDPTEWAELGGSAVYALGYSVLLVTAACLIFERRDMK